jgi:hypothetical protein
VREKRAQGSSRYIPQGDAPPRTPDVRRRAPHDERWYATRRLLFVPGMRHPRTGSRRSWIDEVAMAHPAIHALFAWPLMRALGGNCPIWRPTEAIAATSTAAASWPATCGVSGGIEPDMSPFAVMNRRRRRTAGRDRVYLAPARGRKVHPILAVYPMGVYGEAARGPRPGHDSSAISHVIQRLAAAVRADRGALRQRAN